jgi:hypothetical protein
MENGGGYDGFLGKFTPNSIVHNYQCVVEANVQEVTAIGLLRICTSLYTRGVC